MVVSVLNVAVSQYLYLNARRHVLIGSIEINGYPAQFELADPLEVVSDSKEFKE